jgi:glycogen synthase
MEQGLRILVVSLEYPPPSLGGYEIMCAQVCEWLEQRGHTLFVLTERALARRKPRFFNPW